MKFTQTYKWGTKTGIHVGIWLGNKKDNFQLQRFTRSENIAESYGGHYSFDSLQLNEYQC